ncbi:dienelactone hydrolase family protein [Fimbriiglobus ruber]|uniref:Dienelactone hydrolase family protein n=2 Tax=Fimbriiglobus ruber TaxID=1908690 RepID=A0A225E421_9BACT|nr:dienelactone hydrolase family protein [Fimbriiglobus ruber]
MRFVPALLGLLVGAVAARAEVVSRPIEYKHGAAALEGLLVYDSAGPAKRPGVLLAHEQGASGPAARAKAGQLARFGYVVLSADLYGKGVVPKDATDASSKLGLTGKDRTLVRERTAVALAVLDKIPQVDPKRVAAVGYGVGGTAVLELARAKAGLEGVVCVHGDLTPTGDDGKSVGAALLVIVGADDPKIPLTQVAAFEDEMRKGGVDWQLVRYGGVVGDFTNPRAGRDLKAGRAYDPDADQRAGDAIRTFLTETFAPAAKTAAQPPPKGPAPAPKPAPGGVKGVPDKATKVLEYVDKHGEAMEGYEGGRTFGNFERHLRATDDKGARIKYREWDVNPLRPGVNRGVERLITGSDGAAYYTDDHYATFKKIR